LQAVFRNAGGSLWLPVCLPGPWPVSSMMTNSRTRTMPTIPNTFTQCGVLDGRSAVGPTSLVPG